jgi:transketolase
MRSKLKENSAMMPQTAYARTKSWITNYGLRLAKEDLLPFASAQLFSVYGRYEHQTRLIPTIINHTLRKETLELHSPDYRRDFIYIDDVVEALALMMQSPDLVIGELFNVGTGREYAIKEVVSLVSGICRFKPKVVYHKSPSRPQKEPRHWQADCNKINHLLGWQPTFSLEQGLKHAVSWFKKHQQGYPDFRDLKEKAGRIRQQVLDLSYRAQSSHIGSCLSIIEILTILYFRVMRQVSPTSPDRDFFILSKGHAAMALYAVLAEKRFLSKAVLRSFEKDGSILSGHPNRMVSCGIEVTTGSLGHGLNMGAGMALGLKRDGKKNRVYVLMGDGELAEGSVWEALLFINRHRLDNLTVIVDRNGLLSLGPTESIIALEPLDKKFSAFGFQTVRINGHAFEELDTAFSLKPAKPLAIIADTVKGKGIPFMEGKVEWHFRSPRGREYQAAKAALRNA